MEAYASKSGFLMFLSFKNRIADLKGKTGGITQIAALKIQSKSIKL